MSDALLRLWRILRELKHLNVYRVAVIYLVVADEPLQDYPPFQELLKPEG